MGKSYRRTALACMRTNIMERTGVFATCNCFRVAAESHCKILNVLPEQS